jgi:hypothetical protein
MRGSALRACGLWIALLVGCAEQGDYTIPSADRAHFESEVLPVLLRDCAFHACHGSAERFFQVFGPGHGRLDPLTRPLDPLTPAEIDHSFMRALSMFEPGDLEHSLLLVKPLAVDAGGASHEGTDTLGRDVYQSKEDPAYRVLHDWVLAGGMGP